MSNLGKGLAAVGLALSVAVSGVYATECSSQDWPHWRDFKQHFIGPDGRVLAANSAMRDSFSEAQSYAMFFALTANDQAAFEQLWRWSVQNLLGADATAGRLPAWHWGRADDGSWRVLDANAASDADLWFAYALLEAGRLWQRPDYQRDGRLLLKAIVEQEVVALPGLGAMLLPGPYGFVQPDGSWRLNPSYLALPQLRRFAQEDPQGPWNDIAKNSVLLIAMASPKGLVADWIGYRASADRRPQVTVDPVLGARGSYDAIRVYLWAGMTAAEDPLAAPLLKSLSGMNRSNPQSAWPPESVDTQTGLASGTGPFGFSAAIAPYLQQVGASVPMLQQVERARSMRAASLLPEQIAKGLPLYYDHVLSLFGLGWIEQRFSFARNGQIQLKWQNSCSPAN
jgi:endoglucanase